MKLIYLLIIAALLNACGNKDYRNEDSNPIQRAALTERAESISQWALRCEYGSVAKEGCSVGDASLFNGLACSSGDTQACAASQASQGADGKVWRAPSRVGVDTENSSSRDMVLGFLLYVLTTKDTEAALRFHSYIQETGKLCQDATDNRCTITPNIWANMYHVWGALGLVRSTSMEINSYLVDELLLVQSNVSETGYQLHLVAVQLYLIREAGHSSNSMVQASNNLVKRQPANPFFQFINGNRKEASRLTLEQAPLESPTDRYQWSFERDTAEQAAKDSMGHEFLTIIRLILR